MFCTNCGQALPKDILICAHCGENIKILEGIKINNLFTSEDNDDDESMDSDITQSEYTHKTVLEPKKIQDTDENNYPIKTLSFFIAEIIIVIPIINIIMLFVWAFNKHTNKNKKAFARSILIWILLGIVLILGIFIFIRVTGYPTDIGYYFENSKSVINSIQSKI